MDASPPSFLSLTGTKMAIPVVSRPDGKENHVMAAPSSTIYFDNIPPPPAESPGKSELHALAPSNDDLFANSPRAMEWLRSQGLVFQTDIASRLPVDPVGAPPPFLNRHVIETPRSPVETMEIPPPPAEETPPSYWRQRFSSAPLSTELAAPRFDSPEAHRELEPQATPSPVGAAHAMNDVLKRPTDIAEQDDGEVEAEVQKWIDQVRQHADGAPVNQNKTAFEPDIGSRFEPQSLADLIASPGSIRGCFEGYHTSDTERDNDTDDEREARQDADEAKAILHTWYRAESEAEHLRSKAAKAAFAKGQRLGAADLYESPPVFERSLRQSSKRTTSTTKPSKQAGVDDDIDTDEIMRKLLKKHGAEYKMHRSMAPPPPTAPAVAPAVARDHKGHVVTTASNPAIIIEERQRLLREKREFRRLKQWEKEREVRSKEMGMGKMERMRSRAQEETKRRREWRQRQKVQRSRQVSRDMLEGDRDAPRSSRKGNPLSKSIGKLSDLVQEEEDRVRRMRKEFEEKLKQERAEKEKAKMRETLRLRLERAKREKVALAKEEMRRKNRWTVLFKIFGEWRRYAHELKAVNDRLAQSRAGMSTAFTAWRYYVSDSVGARQKSAAAEERALNFANWMRQTRAWDKWNAFVTARIRTRIHQKRVARMAWESVTKRFLLRWTVRTRECVAARERRHRADGLAVWTRLNKNWQRWCTYVEETKKHRVQKARRAKLDLLVQRTQAAYESKYEEPTPDEAATSIVVKPQPKTKKKTPTKVLENRPVATGSLSVVGTKKRRVTAAVSQRHGEDRQEDAAAIEDRVYESKYCEFLVTMESRAEERKRVREARKQRQAEQEREQQDRQEALALLAIVSKDASKAGQKYLRRSEARRRKELERLKQEQLEQRKIQWDHAVSQHKTLCVKYYGFRPWSLFMILRRMEHVKAVNHRERALNTLSLRVWAQFATDAKRARAIALMRKEARGKALYRATLRKKVFFALKEYHRSLLIREEAVRKQSEFRTMQQSLRFMMAKSRENQRQRDSRCRKAQGFYMSRLVKRTFHGWKRSLPLLVAAKKAEERRERLRSRVDGWLKEDHRL